MPNSQARMVVNASDTVTERGSVLMPLVLPSWDDARAAAHAAARPLPTEAIPLARADRRVLASPLTARDRAAAVRCLGHGRLGGCGGWTLVGRRAGSGR